jgi:hypothetical protein
MPLPINVGDDAVELASNITLDEGVNEFGIQRQIMLEGDQVVTKLTYDAAPMIEAAAQARRATEGDRWGNGHFVGIIPYAELSRINEQYSGAEERKHQILMWLKANPKLVTFDRFLK